MTSKTRYFVIVSLLVIVVGLGTGLVAYRAGFPAAAFFGGAAPDELRYMPSSASVVAYVEVREVMASELRQRLHETMGSKAQDNGRQEFQNLTDINFGSVIECNNATID